MGCFWDVLRCFGGFFGVSYEDLFGLSGVLFRCFHWDFYECFFGFFAVFLVFLLAGLEFFSKFGICEIIK